MNPCRLIVVGADPAGLEAAGWGEFDVRSCADLDAAAVLQQQRSADALWVALPDGPALRALLHWPALSATVLDCALVATLDQPAQGLALLGRGVQDLLPLQAPPAEVARALRLGIERKRLEQAARGAWATDMATGLPNHTQLIEHVSHLLALREREPAPMALLAVRVEGFASVQARLGGESGHVLRRKVAVRLRAGLRASDVVASIGADSFAVLLAWIDAPGDARKVADKLCAALQRPFSLQGQAVAVGVAVGVSLCPEDGRDANELLRRSVSLAAVAPALGRAGFANFTERGAVPAANDEE
ncbi:GGDEF domain-containing protein [Azohydromonas caseinilytica]|uniref:GGDEF domain-containing protein n=1 Tax=Azohydromonas caseinilytica TaxID=2728836 RepID=A0A848F486_9BURK|nr:GGDEF domain-containing protein [Azohydromonas caseinilytica]NML14202.1 GGDEF domain-containing protein [Azohydromonas caseinilytica]